jgi:hypothetical protein
MLGPSEKTHWTTTKGLRGRMGRTPVEIAEGTEDYGEGECSYIGVVFYNRLGLLKHYAENTSQKGRIKAWILPTPVTMSKTRQRSLAPLREALQILMGRPGWKGDYLFGQALADDATRQANTPVHGPNTDSWCHSHE